ncbi:unnamed protein product [Cyclocybe aegerita]|uniref:Pentatricopeptide repeat-containing protein n=1 Tax=Cyclocybe aegerita TaxID=1973307 RepID=A0A8S0VUB7_CYCAE|nr:unnamed protein product [Cyclocybe aegerita]
MLLASCAPLRSSLSISRNVLRIHGTRQGTTLSFRHAHSIGESSRPIPQQTTPTTSDNALESPVEFSLEFPIDVLNSQTAFRNLTRLIEEGKQDQAATAMTNFLASNPSDDAFHRLKTVLAEAPEANIPLILQLGSGYAAMGHAQLVKEELVPLVRNNAAIEVASRFEQEIDTSHRKPVEVFEEPSDDYMPFVSDTPPSVADLIAEQLPAILPEPVQTDDVFEEEGPEYIYHPPTTTDEAHAAMQSTGVLVTLVETGNYTQAYALLKEIKELEIPIPTSHIYQEPAQAALKNDDLRPAQKQDVFSTWFSLVPAAHEVEPGYEYEETRRLVTQAVVTDIPLIIRFALIMARKGYAERVSHHTIPYIIRWTDWEVGQKFLDDFNAANKAYVDELRPRNGGYLKRKTATNSRGTAIRALAYANRLDEAIRLLPDPDNPTFRLTTYTYNVILNRLTRTKKDVRDAYTPLVKALRDDDATAIYRNSPDLRTLAQELDLAAEAKTSTQVDFGDDLVAALRYLKKNIATFDKSQLPHPFTLVNFMSMYLATGRTRALKMLLDKAIRHSFIATSNFVFAEMLFYRRIGQPNLVVKTFVDHFFLSAVPREEVVKRIARIDSQINNYDPTSGESSPLKRFYPFNESFTLPRGKIWPSRIHCNLIWDALSELTTIDRELEVLYYKLVQYVADGRVLSETEPISAIDELPTPAGWTTSAGSAAFTPFIYRLMCLRGPQFGVRMLREMLHLGIKPTVYHYTELAGYFARKNDSRKAFAILDGMAAQQKNPFGRETYEVEQRGISPPIREYHLPLPTVVTYVSLIRGFLIAKNLEAAEAAFRRLRKVHTHVPGENRLLDLALEDLEAFREDPRNWVYPWDRDRH